MHIQFAELPVFDQERAKAFYVDHLNCRVVADQPMSNDGWRWIELGFPGADTALHFLRRKDEAPSEGPVLVLVDNDVDVQVPPDLKFRKLPEGGSLYDHPYGVLWAALLSARKLAAEP